MRVFWLWVLCRLFCSCTSPLYLYLIKNHAWFGRSSLHVTCALFIVNRRRHLPFLAIYGTERQISGATELSRRSAGPHPCTFPHPHRCRQASTMSAKTRGKAKAGSSAQKRTSELLDPEEQLLARQSTTDVELLNINTRNRRIRTKVDIVPTAPRPLDTPLFDFPYNEDDPNFPILQDSSPSFDSDFDISDTLLQGIQEEPEIPGLTLKTSNRNRRYLNSVRHHLTIFIFFY